MEGSVQSKGVRSGKMHVDNILPGASFPDLPNCHLASSTLPLEAQPRARALPEETTVGMVVTGSPGTGAVVPQLAVVDGLVAHGISGMHIGSTLHQDLHTSQQAIASSQVQWCGAMACLPVRLCQG